MLEITVYQLIVKGTCMNVPPKTILLVEDEAIIAFSERRWLNNEGFNVIHASTGDQAVEIADAHTGQIDLILMDIDLGPGIDGIEASNLILKSHDVPLIFLSSHTENEIITKAEQITSYGYVLKGPDPTGLIVSIKMAFKLHQSNLKIKQHEQALIERGFWLEESQRIAKIGSYKTDFNSGHWTSSGTLDEIFGIDKSYDRSIEGWVNIVHPEDREMMAGYLETIIKERKHFDKVYRVKRINDRTELWVHGLGKMEYDDCGNPLTMIGTIQDVTENKLINEALSESEESLSITLHSIGDGVIATDINGCVTRMNPTAERMCGWNIQEANGLPLHNVFNIINSETRQVVENPVQKVLETGMVIGLANHTVLISRDGSEYQIADSAAPIVNAEGNQIGVVLVFSDVTEKYESEKLLAESEKQFRLLAEAIPQIVWITRPDGWNIFFNQKWVDYTGLTLEESYGNGWNKPFHPDDQKKAWDAWQNAVINNTTYSLECRLRRFDGEYQWWLIRGVPVYDEAGKIARWFGTCTNIQEIKLAAQEIENQKQFFEQVFSQSITSTQILDTDGWCCKINQKLTELFGVNPEHIEGKVYNIFNDGEIKKNGIDVLLRDVFDNKTTAQWEVNFDIGTASDSQNITIAERKKAWFKNKAYPVVDSSGNLINVIIQHEEITENKRQEEEIRKKIAELEKAEQKLQKYAGELKASNSAKDKFLSIIAHDIRGPFVGFIGVTEDLKQNLDSLGKEDISEFVFILNLTAQKLYGLLTNLLEWSRLQTGKMEFHPNELNLFDELESTISLFSSSISSKSISITNMVDPNTRVYADINMIPVVLRNLISNAIKFSPNGGPLSIHSHKQNGFWQISISNTGPGMTKEECEKCFDFEKTFTTKGTRGEDGSGLGLILCKELIKENGGNIWVESEPLRITTFTFTLPCLQ